MSNKQTVKVKIGKVNIRSDISMTPQQNKVGFSASKKFTKDEFCFSSKVERNGSFSKHANNANNTNNANNANNDTFSNIQNLFSKSLGNQQKDFKMFLQSASKHYNEIENEGENKRHSSVIKSNFQKIDKKNINPRKYTFNAIQHKRSLESSDISISKHVRDQTPGKTIT